MEKVVDFYKNLPFNYTSDINFYIDQIKSKNQILEYEDLHEICLKKNSFYGANQIKNVLEFGCGTGWLTNTLAYTYKKNVTAIDFTVKAIVKTAVIVIPEAHLQAMLDQADPFLLHCFRKWLDVSRQYMKGSSSG